jgi:hypothetical protein
MPAFSSCKSLQINKKLKMFGGVEGDRTPDLMNAIPLTIDLKKY